MGTCKVMMSIVSFKNKIVVAFCNIYSCYVMKVGDYGYGVTVLRHFQQYFSFIVAVSFIGGGNRSTQRKNSTFIEVHVHVHVPVIL
jgi:hypothetical protein